MPPTQDMIDRATATLIAAANDLGSMLPSCGDDRGTVAHALRLIADNIERPSDRLYRGTRDLAQYLAVLARTEHPRSHSDLDLELRQSPATRCPSCGGQTGAYDGAGDWWPCSQCQGTGYRDGTPPGYDAIPF